MRTLPFSIFCIVILASGANAAANSNADQGGTISQQISDLKQQVLGLKQTVKALSSRMDRLDPPTPEGPRPAATAPANKTGRTESQIATIKLVIAQCVSNVHIGAPSGALDYEVKYWQGFDAYYNPGTSQVLNNATVNGQQPALYAFQKCMSEHGFPLS
jgi:hypothetical protein